MNMEIKIGLIIAIMIVTEIAFLLLIRMEKRKISLYKTFFTKLISIIIGITLVGFGFLGIKILAQIDFNGIGKQLTGLVIVIGIILTISIVCFVWLKLNQYIANKYIIKEKQSSLKDLIIKIRKQAKEKEKKHGGLKYE